MQVGDLVQCISETIWTKKVDIKVGDVLEIESVKNFSSGNSNFRLKGKNFTHMSQNFKLVKMYKVGDKFNIKGSKTIFFATEDDRKFDRDTYVLTQGDYVVRKVNKTTIHFDRNMEDGNNFIVKIADFDKIAIFETPETKELVGYELIKDSILVNAGTFYDLGGKTNLEPAVIDGVKYNYAVPIEKLLDTNWFKPVNKIKVILLKNIGTKGATISVSKKNILIESKSDTPVSVVQLNEFLEKFSWIGDLGSFSVRLQDLDAKIFRVGCVGENNLVSYNEVLSVLNTYNSLNGSNS